MTFKEILNGIDSDFLARMSRKVPEWSGVQGLSFPTRLSMEQCSSSATARYKAALASTIFQRRPDNASAYRPVICDLTGGLGVDCWAFSQMAAHVHHNEMNQELSEAVQANFAALGVSNASFSSIEVTAGKVAEVTAACGKNPDIIFVDPARRSGTGKKVFLLEDCSPDILTLKDELLAIAPDMLVKLSPMADITMVCRRLGRQVREIHVVEAEGECKELLVWMQRSWDGEPTIVFKDIRFTLAEEEETTPAFADDAGSIGNGACLFEPSPSLLKAGCFNLVCGRFGLEKFGRFTHLYLAGSQPEGLEKYGKVFRISRIVPFDGKTAKALGKEFPRCEVTSRNLPVSSDELRKKMGVASGGDTHIFACTADFLSGTKRIMLVTSRI